MIAHVATGVSCRNPQQPRRFPFRRRDHRRRHQRRRRGTRRQTRGVRVCLLEQGDFASGTSSKSTRSPTAACANLRNREFGFVRQSQRERLLLRRLLPHVVTQSFCCPVYRDGPDPVRKGRLGLTAYDLLAGQRNPERQRILKLSDELRNRVAEVVQRYVPSLTLG